MADREKVISGLTCCQTINEYCDECPYNRISYDQCTKVLTKEALGLLKEQPDIEKDVTVYEMISALCENVIARIDSVYELIISRKEESEE